MKLPEGAPSAAAVRACIDWWNTLSQEEKTVFSKAKLTPASWWVMQPIYRMAVLYCDECQEAIEAGEIRPESVSASYVWKYEGVTAFGHMEVWKWAKKKNHGKLLAVEHYQIDSPFCHERMLVQHNASSKFFKSYRGRAWMKDMLTPKWSKLVNLARKLNKQDWIATIKGGVITCKIREFHSNENINKPNFISWNTEKGTYTIYQDADQAYQGAETAIKRRLGMNLEEFWRYASGAKTVPDELLVDNRPKQLDLF